MWLCMNRGRSVGSEGLIRMDRGGRRQFLSAAEGFPAGGRR